MASKEQCYGVKGNDYDLRCGYYICIKSYMDIVLYYKVVLPQVAC